MADPTPLALIISKEERDLCELLMADSNKIASDGIKADIDGDGIGELPYATSIYPVDGYAGILAQNPSIVPQISDGNRSLHLVAARYMMPFTFHAAFPSHPGVNISTVGSMLSIVIPTDQQFKVARKAVVTANFTAWSSVTSQRMDYWVEVNGVATTVYRLFFNEASSHRSASGSWPITIPPGAVTILLKVALGAGSGTINFDTNDFLALTVLG